MTRKYYSLLTLVNGKWAIQFGDYDRDVVRDEAEEYKGDGYQTKIICTGDSQVEIDARINGLNKGK